MKIKKKINITQIKWLVIYKKGKKGSDATIKKAVIIVKGEVNITVRISSKEDKRGGGLEAKYIK